MTKHSRQRAKERYNLELTKKDEQEIISMLKNNNFMPLATSENDKHRKFAYVTYKNIPLKVLYHRTNKGGITQIITVYPFNVDEFNGILEQQKEQFVSRLEHCVKFLKANGYIVYKRKGIDK